MDRRWVQRLIDEERLPALLLLVAGAAGLLLANTIGGFSELARGSHADALLVIFFFVAGLELRHELTDGALTSLRTALVPVVAAAFGMLIPAALFFILVSDAEKAAWGVPMATDLPLALALLAVVGRGLSMEFRAFILTLAIVDDALSIVVVAIRFGNSPSILWLVVVGMIVGCYAIASSRSWHASIRLAIALIAFIAMLRTGVYPTVLGVVIGLCTSRDVEAIRDRWQPVSAFFAVPVFVLVELSVHLSVSSINMSLITAISIARVVGKPLGILVGAALAVMVLRPQSRLSWVAYGVAGSTAGLGLSVSMLFAELSLQGDLLLETKLAVVVALVIAAVVGTLSLLAMRRLPNHR